MMEREVVMRWFASRCLFVVVASLLLLGCKTNTAADVEARIPFEVLDIGQEPRTALRYSIADGTTTTSTTTFRVSKETSGETTVVTSGVKSLEVETVFGPAKNSAGGILYDYEITAANAVVAPGASAEARSEIRRSAASLKGAGATASFNDRGRMLSSSTNERAMEVPVRALLAIVNTERALSLIVLPQQEVGIGARHVSVIGYLDTMPTITGYAVTPVVGMVSEHDSLDIDRTEVEYAFEVPLSFLMDSANDVRSEWHAHERRVPMTEFHWEGQRIWGATAFMIIEFRKILLKQ